MQEILFAVGQDDPLPTTGTNEGTGLEDGGTGHDECSFRSSAEHLEWVMTR
jgi:hypothetical protein